MWCGYSELDEEEVLKEAEADEKDFDAEELFVAKVNHRFEEPDREFVSPYCIFLILMRSAH